MSKLPKATEVKVKARCKKVLERYTRKQTAKSHYLKRGNIVLMAASGMGNNQIARGLSITNNTVRKWRDRWAMMEPQLEIYSQGVNGKRPTDKQLLDKMLEILTDAPRPGRPAVISEAAKQQIKAMSCEKPEKYGLPVSVWSHQLLAKTVVGEQILPKISPRYVGVILKKANFVPTSLNTGSIPT